MITSIFRNYSTPIPTTRQSCHAALIQCFKDFWRKAAAMDKHHSGFFASKDWETFPKLPNLPSITNSNKLKWETNRSRLVSQYFSENGNK